MEPEKTDNQGERQGRAGTRPLAEIGPPRSNLSLPGAEAAASAPAPTPAASTPARQPARARIAPTTTLSVQEGVTRVRNIAHAVVMIVALLLRYLFVKVIGARLYRVYARAIMAIAHVLYFAMKALGPHVARLRARAAATRNRAVKIGLAIVLIVVAPLEKIARVAAQGAKVHGARLASDGVTTTVQVLKPIVGAIAQVIKAGFQTAVVRKALTRLIQILEEAQR